jgi:opacity protein-like surface antigen
MYWNSVTASDTWRGVHKEERMKYVLRLCVLAAAMLMAIPGPARAADMDDGVSSLGLNPYIGLGLGVYNLKFHQGNFNQSNNMFGGFAKLGVDFNDYLGAQLRVGLTEPGKTTYPGSAVTLRADYLFSYLVKLQLPITQEFNIYGLAGGTTGKMNLKDTSGAIAPASANKTATGASFGGGIDYRVDDFMHVGIEYMRYWSATKVNKTGFPAGNMNVESYTATLKILM